MTVETLITDHIDLWTGAVAQKSASGRGSSSKRELTGLKKLRELILELAVRGKLVPQTADDEPADVLAQRIEAAKNELIRAKSIRIPKPSDPISDGEKEFPEPQGWQWVRLSSLGQIVGGGTPKSKDPECWSNGQIPWLTPADLYGLKDKMISSGKRNISKKGLDTSSATLMPKGSVLFSSRAPIGYVAIAGAELATNQGFKSCVPYLEGMSDYLYYFLVRSGPKIDAAASGTTFKEISGSGMARVCIPLPPLAEQHRIVQKVDELMALCDQLEQQTGDQIEAHERLVDTLLDTLIRAANATELAENWARVQQHFDTLFTTEHSIDRLKQTILQLAVMGRLVPQDSVEQPAEMLIDCLREARAELVKRGALKKMKKLPVVDESEWPHKLPDGWVLSRLGEVYDVRDGTHDSPKYQQEGYPLITSKNLSSGELTFDDVKFISETDHQKIQERSHVDQKDILFAMIGSIGNPVLVNTDRAFSIKNVALFKYISREHSSPEFLKLFLEVASTEMKERAAGGVQSFVSLGQLRSWVIAMPPLQEQKRIVQKVTQLATVFEEFAAQIVRVERLKSHLACSVVETAIQQ